MKKKTIVDLVDRAGATFVQAFAAGLTVGSFTDYAALKVAGVAGGYSVAKFLAVRANAYLSTPGAPPA